jgi:hypothetical protein
VLAGLWWISVSDRPQSLPAGIYYANPPHSRYTA